MKEGETFSVTASCDTPIGVQARKIGDANNATTTTQVVHLDLRNFECKESDQTGDETCQNYETRFCCRPGPSMHEKINSLCLYKKFS